MLFIDEAYCMEPGSNSNGKSVVNQLMTAAENQRDKLTIIFAGYKDDIEDKLYGFNPGMKSRFRDMRVLLPHPATHPCPRSRALGVMAA